MRLWCLADDPFGQRRCRVDHVLAVVENQEDLLVAEKRHTTAERIVGLNHEPERRGDCRWDELGIGQRAQIDKGDRAAEAVQECMRNRNGDGRLAYAAWADDAHEAPHHELLRYGSNSFISTDHPCQSRRQLPGSLAVSISFGSRRPCRM